MRGRFAVLSGLALVLAGCIGSVPVATDEGEDGLAPAVTLPGAVTIHRGTVEVTGDSLAALASSIPSVLARSTGHDGAEPTLGVLDDGTIFFIAFENVLRSRDHGETWEDVTPYPVVRAPVLNRGVPPTLDPFLHVDRLTNRVFVNQLTVACSYMSISDNGGDTWIVNPVACGRPGIDHQKVGTAAPHAGSFAQPVSAAYPNLVYFAYNDLANLGGSSVSISLDGGLTFPVTRETVPSNEPFSCSGGLHGNVRASVTGTLYIPKRSCFGMIAATSYNSGFTWTQQLVGGDVGSTKCRKNPDIGTDTEGHAYAVWPAADEELYLARSVTDGRQWSSSTKLSPPQIEVATMPVIAAGSPGRIAVAYYGIERDQTEDAPPDRVSESGRWHLYLTTSQNALDDEPTFVTVRVTPEDDPIQIGPISTNSGCGNPPGSRNLLDFIDIVLDKDGRAHVAYADGCTEGCAGNPEATMANSRSRLGMLALVAAGPSLYADLGELPALPGLP
ncbi:MAG TPA: sialidase family protein [Candidatus Thermoplasmatota archaeon]|nr:sialidase family protein [Candidatus Thermoplasmatota archaeon]